MEKVSVFIDGGYLDHIIQDIGKKVDYSKLARKLCGSDNISRVTAKYADNLLTHR